MAPATIQINEAPPGTPETESPFDLFLDPRWQVSQRIAESESFQKSTRLPKLLLYLARHTILGDRHALTEQMIGQAVLGKERHYNPAEDSSVRVYIRQLRLRLEEYYRSAEVHEALIVSVPKGGYALAFLPNTSMPLLDGPNIPGVSRNTPGSVEKYKKLLLGITSLSLLAALVCAIGWHMAAVARQPIVPWPLSIVVHKDSTTTLVTADSGFALRMLGKEEVPLDQYIDNSYLQPLLPQHMSEGESIVLHYFGSSRITSEADVHAASVLTYLSAPYGANINIRSARDINANELMRGDFIFIGSKTSNPWVELLDNRMNFQLIEDGPRGARYLVNRHPLKGEQETYRSSSLGTLASGEDYAVIALLPAKTGSGSMLLLEGVRMEGTNAAIALLQTPAGRSKLQSKLSALNGGRPPQYFEALLHAQSVAGATIAVDVVAARIL